MVIRVEGFDRDWPEVRISDVRGVAIARHGM